MTSTPYNTANAVGDLAASSAGLVSLTEWITETDREEAQSSLTILGISTEPVYVSLFTDQGSDVTTHYLERTETWAGGYVNCLGRDCPACAAQINRKRFMLLPIADLTDARVKILLVPFEKGPSKLFTELLKVLSLECRTEIITKITRSKKFQYAVDAHRQDALNPDVAAAIKRFVEELGAKVVDLRSVITSLPASEMAQHERVAKRLALEGPGPWGKSE
jgi:hypothetical protein